MNQNSLRRWRRRARAAAVVFACMLGSSSLGLAQPPSQVPPGQAPPGQSEFVPINELPPSEQLPAAPLLIGAYAFVWVGLLAYLWSIWRRLGKVERELATLAKSTPQKYS